MFVRSIKIKQRLFATFLLLGIIPVLILGLAASLESRKAVRGLVGTYSGQLAIQLGVTVQNEMEIIKNRVFEITLDPLVQEGLRNFEKSAKAEQFKMTDELKKAYQTAFVNEKKVKFFSVYSDKASIDYGKLETGINLGSGDIKAEVAARAKAAKGAPVWFVDKNGNLIMCYTVSGVKNKKPFATAMLALEASFLSDIVKKVNLGNGAQVELINKENILVASSPNDILKPGEAFPYPVLLEEINKNEAKKQMIRELQNLKLSETMYASYCPIEGTDWYLVSAVPLKKLDGSSAAIRVNIFVTGCMCTLGAFATAIFISRTITKPLGKIVKV
ncbi:MAG: cache domain-containing protein, partial [Clostridia bacterium]|nr:cache domain-containing protein [Clostridia bacterium]